MSTAAQPASAKPRLGMRAVTMQQPFAAAMAAGVGLYTRRGKPTALAPGGEWVAVHCGQNDEHVKNPQLMREIRRAWPACPSDAALRAGQRSILGVAHFVDGACDARAASAKDAFLALYDCSKPVAWRADAARACAAPLPYPKGNLQLWHLLGEGFTRASDGALLLQLPPAAAAPPEGKLGEGKKRKRGSEAAGAGGGKAAKR
jgi:hypothetical protein